MDPEEVKETGLRAIGLGFVPILLRRNGKIPLAGGWQKTTPDGARETFSKVRSSHNVGIVTGKSSNVIVIDVEKEDLEKWNQLLKEHPKLEKTLKVRTGGGGLHVYFEYRPELADIRNGVKIKLPLVEGGYAPVDIRTNAGQVVIPHSVHENGNQYEYIAGWKESPDGEIEVTIADMPSWLSDSIREEQSKIGSGKKKR